MIAIFGSRSGRCGGLAGYADRGVGVGVLLPEQTDVVQSVVLSCDGCARTL